MDHPCGYWNCQSLSRNNGGEIDNEKTAKAFQSSRNEKTYE
jgi:hypothetical protein